MNDLLLNLAATLVFLPGPVLPSLDDVVALVTPPAAERAAAPAALPSVDALLALPSGFRAPGFEALTAIRTGALPAADTRFDLTDASQWPARDDEARLVSITSVAGN